MCDLAGFLRAAGGFRPPEELKDRMRAFEQLARFSLKLRHSFTRCSIGGMKRTGDLAAISKRDFGLNVAQKRVCISRAKDFLREVAHADFLRDQVLREQEQRATPPPKQKWAYLTTAAEVAALLDAEAVPA